MKPTFANPYDAILYPSHSFAQTHPDRLAAIATLFGMKPAPVEQCRVLELACGDGSNLLPMAFSLPESAFVGVDLAGRPIARGQNTAGVLGLKNVELRCEDLLDFPPESGRFDFIIAHGLYAWVPATVQDKLLAICRAHLAPQGVAYVSYNTYPGCHLRDMLREMMLFHVRGISDPEERTRQAVGLVKFLASAQTKPELHQLFLQKELEHIMESTPAYLFHDDLADINEPVYFHQFARHAAGHGLQYLGEADYVEMQEHIYAPEVVLTLKQLSGDRILREQYLDFLKCRRFRQTLLCHVDVALETEPRSESVKGFFISSSANPASSDPDLRSRKLERFTGKKDAAMETDYPLAKAAMVVLREAWPRRLKFDELLACADELLGSRASDPAARSEEVDTLAAILLQTYASGLVQFHVHSPRCAVVPGERPAASALARLQIERGHLLTNLLHDSVMVEGELAAHLLRLLDGTRGRTELLAEMCARIGSNDSTPIKENLDKSLVKLAKMGLLIT